MKAKTSRSTVKRSYTNAFERTASARAPSSKPASIFGSIDEDGVRSLQSERQPSAARTHTFKRALSSNAAAGAGGISLADLTSRIESKKKHAERSSIFQSLSNLRNQIEIIIRNVPIFSASSDEFVQKMSARVLTHSLQPGHSVTREREPGESLLYVHKGQLRATSEGVEIFTVDAGMWYGEANLLRIDDIWRVSMCASGETRVYEMTYESFEQTLRLFPTERAHFEGITMENKAIRSRGILTHTCPLFEPLNRNLLDRLDARAIPRLYFAGENIIEKGEHNCLSILLRGSCTVELAGRVVRSGRCVADSSCSALDDGDSSVPVVFGELGFLNMQSSESTCVVAQTCCFVRVIPRAVLIDCMQTCRQPIQRGTALQLLDPRDEIRQRTTRANMQGLDELSNFFAEANCSGDFIKFLHAHLEDRLFFPDEVIVDATQDDRSCMYFCREGSVAVIKDGVEMNLLGTGAIFGQLTVLGMSQRKRESCVARSITMCQVLHQIVIVRALELFIEERQKVLAIGFHQQQTDAFGRAPTEKDGLQAMTDASFLNKLKDIGLFQELDPGFIEELRLAAIDRIYMPDEVIIREGEPGESMFIMVSGSAVVFVADARKVAGEGLTNGETAASEQFDGTVKFDPKSCIRVGELKAGAFCGELAMLGLSKIRSATIQAQTMCVLWEVTQEKALALLEKNPQERQVFANLIVKNLERTVPSRLLTLRLFKEFDRKFRMLLGLYCERQAYFPGQIVVREGEVGDKMLINNLGTAEMMKRGFCIKLSTPGTYFGAGNMLGLCKTYCCTLIVATMSHVLCVPRIAYVQAMEKYEVTEAAQEMKVAVQKIEKDLRSLANRVTARMMILKRYQLKGDAEGSAYGNRGGRGSLDAEQVGYNVSTMSSLDLMIVVTKTWASWAQQRAAARQRRRQELARYQMSCGHWKTKKDEAYQRVAPKRILDELIRRNCSGRGEILLPEQLPYEDLVDVRQMQLPHVVSAIGEAASVRTPSVDIRQSLSPTPRSESRQLVSLLSQWPTPRQSPHYSLHVWEILGDCIDEDPHVPATSRSGIARSTASSRPLLPLLSSSCSPQPPDQNVSEAGSAVTSPEPKAGNGRLFAVESDEDEGSEDKDPRLETWDEGSATEQRDSRAGQRRRSNADNTQYVIQRLTALETQQPRANFTDLVANREAEKHLVKIADSAMPKHVRKSLMLAAERSGLGQALQTLGFPAGQGSRQASPRPSVEFSAATAASIGRREHSKEAPSRNSSKG